LEGPWLSPKDLTMFLFNKIIVWFMPLVPKFIVKIFSKPYVAGPNLLNAVDVVKKLNTLGIIATMDVLGESASHKEESEKAVDEYFRALDIIKKEKLNCNISIKPTQLGLLLDKDFCYFKIRSIVSKAAEYNNFVRIDMESSLCTQTTIDLFLRLRAEFSNVGIVLQAYLRRSLDDVINLSQERANFRLCKGIYVESRNIAYKEQNIINDNFAQLIQTALKAESYVGIATHDEHVVWKALSIIHQLHKQNKDYEFQMLLGVDEQLRDILVSAGHTVRVYVPYGENWYAYSMRRLQENPKIALYIIKALFKFKKRK
jgi:proline dehydrogenase